MSVLILKIVTFITTLIAGLVYNFRKHVKGIKTKYNIRYTCGKKNVYQYMDVHYHKNREES